MEAEGSIVNGTGKKPHDPSGELSSLPEIPRVDVHIVTWGSSSTIIPCIESVLAQRGFTHGSNLFVRVSDNASSDGTADLVHSHFGSQVILVRHVVNLGFCAGQNTGIAAALRDGAKYVMLLNPDVRLEPDAILQLVSALEEDPSAGWATPRLYRADRSMVPVDPPRFDTTGVYMTPAIRHFDRGSEQLDGGEYEQREYVFGASGAAALLRGSFVSDATLPDRSSGVQLFDERFFAYREDADLGWRAQWLGWGCLYVPESRGYHVRHVLPERRSSLAPELNAYSVRNRFLMQINNLSWSLAAQLGLEWNIRNTLVMGGAIVKEPQSRREILLLNLKFPRAYRIRRLLMSRRRSSATEVARWFQSKPYAEPALAESPAAEAVRTVTAVIVSFNSGSRVTKLVESLQREQVESKAHGVQLHIAIVDNESTDGSLDGIRDADGLTVIRPGSNIGFGPAVNLAAEQIPSDAILVLNPDVLLPRGAVLQLAAQLDRFSSLAVIAPVLTNHDGTPQKGFTARRFPTLKSVLAELFGLHRLFPSNCWTSAYLLKGNPVLSRYLDAERVERGPSYPQDRPYLVDQPAGACMLVRSSVFHEVGGFDAQFAPAWYEDVDLLKRIRNRGHLAALLGSVRVPHEGGYSLSVIRKARFSQIFFPNLVRYFDAHGTSRDRFILRMLLPIALMIRAIGASFTSLFADGKEREERRTSAQTLWKLAWGGAWAERLR